MDNLEEVDTSTLYECYRKFVTDNQAFLASATTVAEVSERPSSPALLTFSEFMTFLRVLTNEDFERQRTRWQQGFAAWLEEEDGLMESKHLKELPDVETDGMRRFRQSEGYSSQDRRSRRGPGFY